MIFKLAFYNLFRHRTRFLLSLLTISGAVASTVVFRGYAHNVLDKLRVYGAENQFGHVQVGLQTLWSPNSQRIKEQLYEVTDDLDRLVRERKDVVSVSPRLSLQGLISNENLQFGAKFIGYDPSRETTFRTNMNLIDGAYIEDVADLGVLLGSGLQERLKIKVGDSISVVTQTVDGIVNASDLTVRGVFQTSVADIDNQVAFVPLSVAQSLLDTNHVEVLIVRLDSHLKAGAVGKELTEKISATRGDMTVKTWRDLADMYRRSEEFFRIQNTIVQAILGLLTVLAILNTVGMTVYERTGEIGTVRSLGVTRAGIVSQFMLEGLYLGLLGALIGSALGVVAISGINAAGFMTAMPGASTDIPIQADVVLSAFMIAALMGLFSTLIGTFVPAWRASRLSVVDALRRNM